MSHLEDHVRALSCWSGPLEIAPLAGGLTNRNFIVRQRGERFVVRIGDDNPVHLILRWHERAAAEAASRAGIAPDIIHAEAGALVMRHIDGRTLTPGDIADPQRLPALIALIRRCHIDVQRELAGPALAFWPFHVARHYARVIAASGGVWAGETPRLLALTDRLEAGVGPVDLVFGHNDLLAANVIDDGHRLWLIDYDYAGFNSPLFDLANLASNNGLSEDAEQALLAGYCQREPDAALLKAYAAMRAASLLREMMWSMVSETHSLIAFDYHAYTLDYQARLEQAVARFDALQA